jgi:LemA protein
VVENYPDLKADKNFLDFQKKLSDIENTLQHARRYYNGAVRDLNNLVEAFPSSIVASISGFKEAEFFQLDDPSENIVPDIDLH